MGRITSEAMLFAIGVAVSAAGAGGFKSRRFPATLSSTVDLRRVWLGFCAFSKVERRWVFARFAPANVGTVPAGASTTFSACLDVEDYGGCFCGPRHGHGVVLLALSEAGPVVGFNSPSQGAAFTDVLDELGSARLESLLEAGDVGGMRDLLADFRYLTPSTDGVLVGFPSGRAVGVVRIEQAPALRLPAGCGMDTLSVFPRRSL